MMSLDLNTLWFALVGILLTGYAMLDGFDLGVGILHPLIKADHDRRIFLNSIGPVWDGNEVWLVTGGGALFAAFPRAYATVFSGFYLAFMMLLFMLIFRAVAIEFRSKRSSARWRGFWDYSFTVGSLGAAFLTGVALGNIAHGVALDANGDYVGSFVQLLRPYPVVVGLTTVAMFAMHGNLYLVLKTEGQLQKTVRGWVYRSSALFVVMYLATTVFTLLHLPHMTTNLKAAPALFAIPALNVLAVLNIYRELKRKNEWRAFLSSCMSMAFLMLLFGVGMYPHLVYSRPLPELSLTIYNAASSKKTLTIMAIIAGLGVPIVLAYTVSIYWIFRGKVKLDSNSY
jgi:cytochrome d ubiquinol oxidase subunit II